MKKFFTLIATALCFYLTADAQFEYVSGTIKNGTQANSVILALKSNTTFIGNFSNVQFTIQIPNTVSPQPTLSVIANPMSTYWSSIVIGSSPDVVVDEGGFYNYTFSKVFVGSPAYSFTAGVEVNALEIQLTNAVPGAYADVLFGHLANGGSSGASAFYIEMGGTDYTNYTSMFYGPGNSNGGLYETYNYVPILGISLPVTLTAFNAIRKEENALLSWSVENQTASNSYFSIERSLNGIDFATITTIPVDYNGNNKADYNYTDRNIVSLKATLYIYYRIKQVDLDGKYVYSTIRKIRLSDIREITVQPNPVMTTTLLQFESSAAAKISLQLADMNGKTLQTILYTANIGSNRILLDLSKYSSGNYYLILSDGKGKSKLMIFKH